MAGLTALLDYFEQRNENERINEWARQRYADNPDMLNLMQASPSMAREAAQRAMAAELDPELQMRKQFMNSVFGGQQQQQPQQSALGQLGQQNPMQIGQSAYGGQQQRTQSNPMAEEKALAFLNPEAYIEWKLTEDARNIKKETALTELDKIKNPEKYDTSLIKSKKEMAPALTTFVNTANDIKSDLSQLDKMRAIPSTKRSVASNVGSYIANTALGDVAGQMAGTEAQMISDTIDSKIPIMKQQIMGITGMSARQLDSNVEMQSFMKTFGDKTSSYEARTAAINNLLDFANTYAEQRLGQSITNGESKHKQSQGKVYVNPQTGQRITKVNGKWVTLQ